MSSGVASPAYDRVLERRRAVALARHFRDAEGFSIAQIAARLGRSPATIKAYFHDPTGEKARAEGSLRGGVPRLRRVHAAAQRQGRRVPVLQALPPGAIASRWTQELVLEAIREWHGR
jgi:AcrR family transcriptional regulator